MLGEPVPPEGIMGTGIISNLVSLTRARSLQPQENEIERECENERQIKRKTP